MSVLLASMISVMFAVPLNGAAASPPVHATAGPAVAPAQPAAPPFVTPALTPMPVVAPVATPVATVATPDPSSLSAAQLLSAGRLLEAALEYEEAWRRTKQPQELVGAATAREAMGHRGHAAAYLRELMVVGQGDAGMAARVAGLERGLVPVRVVVTTPERASALVVRARYLGRAADGRPDLIVRTVAGPEASEVVVPLDAGRWELWVDDEYYREGRQEITVTAGAATVVPLRPEPRDTTVDARRLVSPGLLFIAGIGMLAGGQVEVKRVLRRSDAQCDQAGFPCQDLMSRGVSLRGGGAGMLGASLGIGAAHLALLSPKRRVRQAVWISQASAGLVGVIAGSVGVALTARTYNSANREVPWSDPDLRAELHRSTAEHTTAAFFLGFGAGMLVRSIGHLIRTSHALGLARRDRGVRKEPLAFSPTGGPSSLGAALTTRF